MVALFESLFAVALVAALAPVITAVLPGPSVPQVVFLIIGGILIGPEALGLADPVSMQALAQLGLGFLFLLAGYEIDESLFRRLEGRLAIKAWVVTAVLATAVTFVFASVQIFDGWVEIAIAMTTTALGTLLPILRENGTLGRRLGPFVVAAGATGEFLPVIAMALLLSSSGALGGVVSLASLGLTVYIVVRVLMRLRKRGLVERLGLQEDGTGQIFMRWTILLLAYLLYVAADEGLDVVLGGFLAGMVLRHWGPGDSARLENKLETVGWGLLIPIFFVNSGMTLDIDSILAQPWNPVIFAVMLLVIRGLPSLVLYRDVLSRPQRWQMALYTATALPLLVALAEVGQDAGVMTAADAATLVGAGVLSVIFYPQIATVIGMRTRTESDEAPAVSGNA